MKSSLAPVFIMERNICISFQEAGPINPHHKSAGQPPRTTRRLAALMAAALTASLGVGSLVLWQGRQEGPLDKSGFDFSQVQDRRPSTAQTAISTRPLQPLPPIVTGMGEPGVTPGYRDPNAPQAVSPSRRDEEREFLKRYGRALRDYQQRLTRITDRYYEQSAAVREVDREFGKLDRYMSVKRRYERDGDAFQFAREAISLPEVRGLIKKYVSNAEVWKAAIAMASEALKDAPPPTPILNEMKRFMAGDQTMSSFVEDFAKDANNNVGLIVQTATSGADLRPILSMAQQLSPGALKGLPVQGLSLAAQ